MHILSKNLQVESEAKEEFAEQLDDLRTRSDTEKAKSMSKKKEITSLTKQHKAELQKVQEELKHVKNSWTSPDQFKKLQNKEKALESQIKSLKDDLARKRDLVNSLKESQVKAEKEVIQVVANIESK